LKRKLFVLVLLIFSVVLLTGCGTMEAKDISELKEGNFFFSTFAYPLAVLLEWLHDLLWNQYGLAILALTVIVRLLVLPLAIKQYKSMKGMQKIQPQMKELREKYKDDPKQMQMETMKLMQEHNVNPAAGCLPLLIQMPILFALYYAINIKSVSTESFIGLELGKPDPTLILPILAAITTIIPMIITSRNQPNAAQMKIMMYIFPVLIFFISYQLPSALPLYWVYSNIFTIVQTYFLYREKPEVELEANVTQQVKAQKNEKKKKRWK
jgi:YidC/Oxa1 family membrane protein insertase